MTRGPIEAAGGKPRDGTNPGRPGTAVSRLSRTVRGKISFYGRLFRDRRTPWCARFLLGLALVYLMAPLDLVPDWIPVFGVLDDVVIDPGLVWVAFRLIPRGLVAEHRVRFTASQAG